MALSALAWCSVDRLKEHLSFYKDEQGLFTNTEQDTKIADCIQGAVSWCSAYTGLPLIERIKQYRFDARDRPSDIKIPMFLEGVVGFAGVRNLWIVPENELGADWVRANDSDNYQTPYNWITESQQGFFRQNWLVYPGWDYTHRTLQWPPLENGLVIDVIEDIPATRNIQTDEAQGGTKTRVYRDYTAVTSAVILLARDLYDGGGVKERRSTAEHLLDPFKVPTI